MRTDLTLSVTWFGVVVLVTDGESVSLLPNVNTILENIYIRNIKRWPIGGRPRRYCKLLFFSYLSYFFIFFICNCVQLVLFAFQICII